MQSVSASAVDWRRYRAVRVSVYFAVNQTLVLAFRVAEVDCRAERTPSPHDMNRQECRTKRIDSVCAVTWIPLFARGGSVIKWGRGEGETLSIHVVWTRCALGLSCS